MSGTQSTIPQAYTNLLGLLQGSLTSNGLPVQVIDGAAEVRIEDAYVALIGVVQAKQYATLGGGGLSSQKEDYTISGSIHCYSGGGVEDTAVVRNQAYDLLNQIDLIVQQNVNLGLPNVNWAVLNSSDLNHQGQVPGMGGRMAELDFTITVSAHLFRS